MAKLPRDLDIKIKLIESLVNAMFKFPEERICQVIYNALRLHLKNNGDIFYVDDLRLLKSLKDRLEK